MAIWAIICGDQTKCYFYCQSILRYMSCLEDLMNVYSFSYCWILCSGLLMEAQRGIYFPALTFIEFFFIIPGKGHCLSPNHRLYNMYHFYFQLKEFWNHRGGKRGKEIKSKQIHALVFSLWLCSAVLRKERDRVGEGEGKWGCEDRKWRRAEKTIDTENTLLLILSEGHSHSFQFQPAACLISPQQRGTGCSRTNTHTKNFNTHVLPIATDKVTQSKCKSCWIWSCKWMSIH